MMFEKTLFPRIIFLFFFEYTLGNLLALSLIQYNPLTGKTHQLRIVSKNLGCSIIGDNKYNGYSKFKNEELKLNAYNLKFIFNDKKYEFFSELSKDFYYFLKKYNFKDLKRYI